VIDGDGSKQTPGVDGGGAHRGRVRRRIQHPGSPSTVNPSQMPNVQHAPERLVIDVIVEGGNVTPTNAELRAKTKQPIIIRINSDTADQLHVHSNPEHNFTVEPRSGQSFQFTVDVPGQVEVELHELSK
jgi:hypothetical protein